MALQTPQHSGYDGYDVVRAQHRHHPLQRASTTVPTVGNGITEQLIPPMQTPSMDGNIGAGAGAMVPGHPLSNTETAAEVATIAEGPGHSKLVDGPTSSSARYSNDDNRLPPSPSRGSSDKLPKARSSPDHTTAKASFQLTRLTRTPRIKSEPTIPAGKLKPRGSSSTPAAPESSLRAWIRNFLGTGRHGTMQFRCFLLTFCAFGSTFMLRSPVGVIRNDVHTELGVTVPHLGWMDTAMLLPLGVLQIVLSGIHLPYSPRQLVAYSLMGAAVSMVLFGIFHSYIILLICLFFSGAFQALVFPQCINALSQWYTDVKVRTTVFGVWGACSALGGLVATAQATALRSVAGWHYVFWVPCGLTAIIGAVVLKFLRSPSGTSSMQLSTIGDIGTRRDTALAESRHTGSDDGESDATDSEALLLGNTYANAENHMSREEEEMVEQSGSFSLSTISVSRTIPVSQLLRIPLLKEVATIYFFVNLLRFAIYSWLPIFLHTVVGYNKTDAGWISMFFETGALLGVPGVAILSDKVLNGQKILAMQIALAFSAGSLLAFYFTARLGMFLNCLFLVMVGFASGGTDMILTGSVAVDLGGKNNCIPGVAGIINGFGILGAVVQGGLIANTYYFTGRTGLAIMLGVTSFVPVFLISRVKRLDKKSAGPFLSGRSTRGTARLSTPSGSRGSSAPFGKGQVARTKINPG